MHSFCKGHKVFVPEHGQQTAAGSAFAAWMMILSGGQQSKSSIKYKKEGASRGWKKRKKDFSAVW
ncbi:hypothetical protein D7X87_01985 [bacterium D16-54]|nr:hypothetical protein D7X87_01985 [bacterium D16-54]RKJ16429.1 hypothetical protein D7X65_01985 [bacterium D16-56]